MGGQTIAIIGAGELGCRVAYAAARAGSRVILEDISAEKLERGVAQIARRAEEEVSREDGDMSKSKRILARIETTNVLEEACREADLIIETVADEEEMKLELFTIFDKFAKPGAIFATTSKAVPVDELAGMTFCADRCVGVRFFSPAEEEKLELCRGRETSDETVRRCREFARRIEMHVAVLEDAKAISARAGS